MDTQIAITNKKFYEGIQTRFVELMDKETFAKEVSFALQHIEKNPGLQKCTRNSVLQAVMNVAQTGLTLNPIASLAYLIPRWSNKGILCVLEPSYQGLIKLVTDTGSVKSVHCYTVFEGDEFQVKLGTSVGVDHIPKFESKTITHVYTVAELRSGGIQVEVMTISDCYKIREKSESYKAFLAKKVKSCVWVEWEQEMCRKCCIKRAVKYLPKTENWEKVHEAVALDNSDYKMNESKDTEKNVPKITKAKSTELLNQSKIIIDEYTDSKGLKANYKAHVGDQLKAGMNQADIADLKKYINAKNVSLKKAAQTKTIDLP